MTGKTHSDIARAKLLSKEGRLKEAIKIVQSLAASKSITNEDRIECIFLESQIRIKLADFEVAYNLINQTLKESKENEHLLQITKILSLKAEVCWRLGKFEEGLAVVEEGQQLLEEISDETDLEEFLQLNGLFLRHGGIIHWYKGELDLAAECHEESLEIYQGLNDNKGMGDSLNNLGLVFWSKGDLDKATEYYQESLRIGELLEDKHHISVILNNLGNVSALKGDIKAALDYHQQALATRQELGNRQNIALSLTNLGAVHESLGNLGLALEYYDQSLKIYEELDLDHGVALALNNLASVYQLIGDLDLALDYLKRSLAIRERLDNQQDVAQSLINLGELHRIKGEPEKALKTYEDSLAIYEEVGNDPYLAIVLFRLVSLTLELEQSLLSEEYLRRLKEVNERTENRAIEHRYKVARALTHKSKKRIRDKLEAQGILEEIVKDEVADHSLTVLAMIHLCELLLTELKLTEEEDVLREVNELTNKLLEIANQQSSHLLLVETYILQSKLALIDFDIEGAMILLSKAEDIAKERGLLLLTQRVEHEHKALVIQIQKWEGIVERNPSKRDMIDLTFVENLVDRMIRKTVSNLSDSERKYLMENMTKRKYSLIHTNILEEVGKGERSRFRVGIAQMGLSDKGDILHEFYEKKDSGLFGIRESKVDLVWTTVKRMAEMASEDGVNILLFPELSIDLNYEIFLSGLLELAQKYQMYIIPGSFHDEKTMKNLCKIIGPDGVLWEQEKHIPATIHYEGSKIQEGINIETETKKVIIADTEFGRIAVVICRDFLDMDLRVELKNSEPPVDLIINPAFTPVTADFRAAHFDARRSIYAYCFFVNIAEFGDSLIYSPEKDRAERTIPAGEEGLIHKDVDLFQLRSERIRWESERKSQMSFIQSTR